jgi:hypothetical protein
VPKCAKALDKAVLKFTWPATISAACTVYGTSIELIVPVVLAQRPLPPLATEFGSSVLFTGSPMHGTPPPGVTLTGGRFGNVIVHVPFSKEAFVPPAQLRVALTFKDSQGETVPLPEVTTLVVPSLRKTVIDAEIPVSLAGGGSV